MKRNFCLVLLALLLATPAFSFDDGARRMFLNNQSVIMGVDIRTFNADDKNKNDIIEPDKGETSGNFTNAVKRLDEIKALGVNTIHLLPITPVGKVKALGTAGSLYAISAFNTINPQLDDPNNPLSAKQEAALFIKECHKRGIKVLIDLPSCGSYDLFLENPNLFVTDINKNPQIPADWTDVRMFKTLNSDGSINSDVFALFQSFIDMVLELNADGIRADVATSKPYAFWDNLIKYTRSKDPEFLFLAEASDSWNDPVAKGAPFTPYDKLLEAGFDGFYGSFFSFKDWKTSDEFEKHMKLIKSLSNKYNTPKSVIGSFSTHDEISPIIIGGPQFSKMIIWLQATLPINTYFMDGFQTGDTYLYKYANQKAPKTCTDDDYYYVHKGKIDIFNFSRKPGSDDESIREELRMANTLKRISSELLLNGELNFLNTTNPEIFAYSIEYGKSAIVVILNKNLQKSNSGTVKYDISQKTPVTPVRALSSPKIGNGKIDVQLSAGDIIVLFTEVRKK